MEYSIHTTPIERSGKIRYTDAGNTPFLFMKQSYQRVHCIGIGGIGISAIARLLLSRGIVVTGSDMQDSELIAHLRAEGARVTIGHTDQAISPETDLVIYSDAVPEDNPERVIAQTLHIPQRSYFQYLGELTSGMDTIAISGTHGKTTTTAMTGLIFEAGNTDPLVIVGSKVPAFGGNLRIGSGPCIVEADEYRGHMLELSPRVIILTNLEADHLDYYRDLADIVDHFQKYVDSIPHDGLAIVNADDPILMKRLHFSCPVMTYGIDAPADVQASDIAVRSAAQSFAVSYRGVSLGIIHLQVPGRHNVSNALAAIAAGLSRDIPFSTIERTLSAFTGTWRRFELVGNDSHTGARIISDYGHHPTEVQKTIIAAREWFPQQTLIVAFQPHQIDRTKKLFSEFVDALSVIPVHQLIISDIYEVPGREYAGEHVTSHDLVREVRRAAADRGMSTEVTYGGDLSETKKIIRERANHTSVVIVMGAGSIDSVARELVRS